MSCTPFTTISSKMDMTSGFETTPPRSSSAIPEDEFREFEENIEQQFFMVAVRPLQL